MINPKIVKGKHICTDTCDEFICYVRTNAPNECGVTGEDTEEGDPCIPKLYQIETTHAELQAENAQLKKEKVLGVQTISELQKRVDGLAASAESLLVGGFEEYMEDYQISDLTNIETWRIVSKICEDFRKYLGMQGARKQ